MVNLIELGVLAQERMTKYREHGKGVSFAMKNLPKSFDGPYIDCIRYLNDKVYHSTVNMLCNEDKELYIGCIALYSKMIDILAEKTQNLKNYH